VPTELIRLNVQITADQDLQLDQLKVARKARGVKVGKNELVREAIDEYLERQTRGR
jgi:hypothetical protein